MVICVQRKNSLEKGNPATERQLQLRRRGGERTVAKRWEASVLAMYGFSAAKVQRFPETDKFAHVFIICPKTFIGAKRVQVADIVRVTWYKYFRGELA